MTLSDRWALIEVLLELRISVVVHSEWPRHAMLAWCAKEEAGQMAFTVGTRWAELDGYRAPLRSHRPFEGSIPVPILISDLPVLAESFSEGYRMMVSSWTDAPPDEPSEHLLLSVFQAASYLGRSEHEIMMLMNGGVLACQWYGGERRVSFKDLEIYRARDLRDEALALEALLAVAELIERESAIRAA
ncbi:MAG: hypothetical protein EPN61_18420 [Burkholderiaceae bacterium]|nr:MAG: hypothetical protein EPN61_18420 [Burkholderiaceae bacterium]